jgi:hypothetical protein
MRVQRVVAPILSILLVVGVALAAFVSFQRQQAQHAADAARAAIVTVHGLIGSEKKAYLTDPRVLAILRKNGVDLQVETAGSREMTTRTDLANYDFVFPAGEPAAKKLMALRHVSTSFSPFYTPMTVASWKPIADILIADGVVKKQGADYYIVDMAKLIKAMAAHERWNELPAHAAYDVGKSILVSSTDVRTSNSAAMYLSLASYLLNGNAIVQDQDQVRAVLPTAEQLFLRQGYQESSSAGPFDDYTTIGMGKSPLVMIYEAQFIEYAVEHKDARDPNMVLLYPKPTVFTKHELIPLDDKGSKLGNLLVTDPDLQKLANEHGLRTSDPTYARSLWRSSGVHVPDNVIDVVDPPSYEILESMIRQIQQKLDNS